jgi:hypothetical protein
MRSIMSLAFLVLAAFTLMATPAVSVTTEELVGEGEKPGTKIVVRGLKQDEGGTLTLRLQMINETDTPEGVFGLLGGALGGNVYLIDAANKKKYLVVKDTSGDCECSQVKGDVKRSASVRQWLVEHEGLGDVRFRVKGLGASRPVAPNTKPDGSDDPEGRQKNRRVEIVIGKQT